MMRLAEFIVENTEAILLEWERFARKIWPSETLVDVVTLRDHAEKMLRATARDMAADQSVAQRGSKSHGLDRDDAASNSLNAASADHGVERMASGFNLRAVMSEYRALRASVVRLWRESRPDPDANDIDDLTRFNESMDQSLAGAVEAYTERVDRSRDTFLAILGHDLRNPLSTMRMAAYSLKRDKTLHPDHVSLLSIIENATGDMNGLIGDLLDYARTTLGDAIPVFFERCDLGEICRRVIDGTRTAHPECEIDFKTLGHLRGTWDADRLAQLIGNLVGNAVQHSGQTCGICVTASSASADWCEVEVHNGGEPIPPELLPTLFSPLKRGEKTNSSTKRRRGSMGLGLYIARAIATAHGGTIDVVSTAGEGTTFTLRVPRLAKAAQNLAASTEDRRS